VKQNKRVKAFELLATELYEDNPHTVEIYATMIKSPTFLVSDRIFIDAKFLWNEEHVSISTGLGLESFKKAYISAHGLEDKNIEFARNILSGFKFSHLTDPLTKRVIGTHILFVSESDFGGSVPKMLMLSIAPRAIHDMIEDLIPHARKVACKN